MVQKYAHVSKQVMPVWEVLYSSEKDLYRAPVLLTGTDQCILIDTALTFSKSKQIIENIARPGKPLSTILITCCDPDYYWGLLPLCRRFPGAQVVAPAEIIEVIRRDAQHKIDVWTAMLGADGPANLDEIVVPNPLETNEIWLGADRIELIPSHDPTRAWYAWVSSIHAIFGGVAIVSGLHNWLAEAPDRASRDAYMAELDALAERNPAVIVPGHLREGSPVGMEAIAATRRYNVAFERCLADCDNSDAVIAAMEAQFPDLALPFALQLGARVCKGEITWP